MAYVWRHFKTKHAFLRLHPPKTKIELKNDFSSDVQLAQVIEICEWNNTCRPYPSSRPKAPAFMLNDLFSATLFTHCQDELFIGPMVYRTRSLKPLVFKTS
jgi:hypothetical protein